jgi:formylglycine-generating enzyme required for sulfatase activity
MASKMNSTVLSTMLVVAVAAFSCADGEPATGVEPPPAPASIQIPSGTFVMGSENGEPDELPLHEVTVSAFVMDRTEVTTDSYQECVDTDGCSPAKSAERELCCNAGDPEHGNHPINCVNWLQATAYCEWRGQRLPTEQEWEYAARGTDGREYPWGSNYPTDQLCWSGGPVKRDSTCPVGSFPESDSPFGIADMAGNVWEFTASDYSVDYSSERTGPYHVHRGSGWQATWAEHVRSANRAKVDSTTLICSLGFRCVQ